MTRGLYHRGKGTRTSWRHDSRVFSRDVHIFYGLQKDWLQLIATGLLTVFKYFQNEATGNRTDPKCGQPQPKKRPDRGLVQFGPTVFFGPIDRTFKH
jgi:uncharacterized iron-regulated membrane protein